MRRVSFNGKFFSGARTGVYRVALELIRGVDEVITAEPRGDRPEFNLVHPRDARDMPELNGIPRREAGVLTWQPWEQLELPWRCRDDLLVNLCNLAPLAAPRSITMIHDAQVFLSPQSYSPAFRTWYQFALPQIGARSQFILTVSEYSKAMLVRFGIAEPDRIRVLHNGVDHLARAPADPHVVARLGLEPGRFVVALANTQKHKNIARLFEVFRRPDFAKAQLVLVGAAQPSDFDAAGWAPPANVTFAGRVSDAELRALFESAAAMALPSTTEGFGLPPVEAMYLGCPAVVSTAGAIPEACGDGALYADTEDTEAWAQALLQLIEDPAARAEAAARGQAHARQKTWRRSSAQLLDWLVEAAA
ncbi:glycosyltransferase family 1 protein [Phenylobacterium hankyongense]|uniref:Glycosyltransferase family 1 protein n=1 Tax=Phenylobacterium hankyongense TaxID=1813876 RepID=A0A328B060_9CAUL|nr:glycosyltransferase family 1 protein [Phenylobacterium hankyongense]RAK60772.1 glycosyltransferase family 1 protein [Phenylobacterium hankyongense]